MELIDWIKDNNIETPVQLNIRLRREETDKNGKKIWFLRVKINNVDVTKMVAELAHLPYRSIANMLIVLENRSTTDLGFYLQRRVYRHAYALGEKDMFDTDKHTYSVGGTAIPK